MASVIWRKLECCCSDCVAGALPSTSSGQALPAECRHLRHLETHREFSPTGFLSASSETLNTFLVVRFRGQECPRHILCPLLPGYFTVTVSNCAPDTT